MKTAREEERGMNKGNVKRSKKAEEKQKGYRRYMRFLSGRHCVSEQTKLTLTVLVFHHIQATSYWCKLKPDP
ncbi:unnamed protein product [Dovyalis caffra]|uniref:Histone H2B n=1 Tax=Dovyalis caffra TaxID=77055 RepID=A0AAV1RKU1_9ROSI|nr:unnamed protein product [Dovyalis caffra]